MGVCCTRLCGPGHDAPPPSYEYAVQAAAHARVMGPRGDTYPRLMTQVQTKEREHGSLCGVERAGTLFFYEREWILQPEGQLPRSFDYREIVALRCVAGWAEVFLGTSQEINSVLCFLVPVPRPLLVEWELGIERSGGLLDAPIVETGC